MRLFRVKKYLQTSIGDQIKKIKEELAEVETELDKYPQEFDKLTEEVADLLQASYTLLLILQINPEKASEVLEKKLKERGVI